LCLRCDAIPWSLQGKEVCFYLAVHGAMYGERQGFRGKEYTEPIWEPIADLQCVIPAISGIGNLVHVFLLFWIIFFVRYGFDRIPGAKGRHSC
jgi:hypothetical protein